VRDILSQRWVLTEDTYERDNPKPVYYLPMGLLIGRSLAYNVTNLLLDPLAKQAALLLGITRQTLRLKLRDLGLSITRPAEVEEGDPV